jgi:hypothetical protein
MIDADPEELCQAAGRTPDELLTKFVMSDVACALINCGWSRKRIITALKQADTRRYGDALCEASGWTDIFETVAQEH